MPPRQSRPRKRPTTTAQCVSNNARPSRGSRQGGSTQSDRKPLQISFDLLRLPLELRRLVYSHFFGGRSPRMISGSSFPGSCRGGRKVLRNNLAILVTCRQIYNECLPTLYKIYPLAIGFMRGRNVILGGVDAAGVPEAERKQQQTPKAQDQSHADVEIFVQGNDLEPRLSLFEDLELHLRATSVFDPFPKPRSQDGHKHIFQIFARYTSTVRSCHTTPL